MNFLKRIFSGNASKSAEQPAPKEEVSAIISETYFGERYTEQDPDNDPVMLDGCLKMVESYFLDNKLERRVESPVNHPSNLDQTMDDGFGFKLYCQAFNMGETEATLFLAIAFSEFMIRELDFKLYKDHQPEYPLRGMTLKYDRNGVLLSLYPYEYASKVLNYEGSFEELYQKIKDHLKNLPSQEELLNQFK
jgi:hypothetical protein